MKVQILPAPQTRKEYMIGKCKECGGRVISQGNLFYSDVVMRVCADCGHCQSAYKKRANKASSGRGKKRGMTLSQIKDKYFPNIPLDELEGRKQEKVIIILPRR